MDLLIQALKEKSGVYQRLLPSFLQLLVQLKTQGRSYSLVFHATQQRKLELLASALEAFALGK